MSAGAKVQPVRSSLPYQILLYLNAWYFGLFILLEIAIYVYKSLTLPYPYGVLAAEYVLLFLFVGLESVRIFFGQKGNLTERVIAVVVSLLLTIPSVFAAIYLLIWQTYVLRAEVILITIQLAFLALELIFAIISVITFARAPHY